MTRCTVSGDEPVNPPDAPVPNSATKADGQHVDHWTMCPTEIMHAGFKRPIRDSYVHVGLPAPQGLRDLTEDERKRYAEYGYVKFEPNPEYPGKSAVVGTYWTQERLDRIGKGCGFKTSMPRAIAETYAANPGYYGSTFCCGCGKYFPVGAQGEFVWAGTDERVGT